MRFLIRLRGHKFYFCAKASQSLCKGRSICIFTLKLDKFTRFRVKQVMFWLIGAKALLPPPAKAQRRFPGCCGMYDGGSFCGRANVHASCILFQLALLYRFRERSDLCGNGFSVVFALYHCIVGAGLHLD